MFIRLDMIHEREKIAVFMYRSPHYCFPRRRPSDYHAIMLHGWKDNSMLAKPLAVCTYLSSSYTMLKSMLKSKNRYFYHIFVSPGHAPGQSR